MVVTLLFMSILLRPDVKAWFLGAPMVVPPSEARAKHTVLTPTNVVSALSAGLLALLWITTISFALRALEMSEVGGSLSTTYPDSGGRTRDGCALCVSNR
ncbi:MAG: hypothetical protein EXQ48_02350 [Acidobacteria bacterium]|nr:hypothetical protein [Acidobacteriota bacterium]